MRDCIEEPLPVGFGGADKDVEIAGEPWRAVKRQRVRADDSELNVVSEQ